MAKRHLTQYDSAGNKKEIYLNDDEVMLEGGKTLDEKLDEIDVALGEAGSGSVSTVKVGETTYEPTDGVVDLSTPFGGKVDKEPGMGLSSNDYTTNEKNKLAGLSNYDDTSLQAAVASLRAALEALVGGADVQGAIDTFNEVVAFLTGISSSDTLAAKLATLVPQARTINNKPLTGNITIGINDIDGLAAAIAAAGSGVVSVTTNQDGTFVIHVGSTDYTINLNHTHENMAKLIVCEESDLPSTLDNSTIYAVVDDETEPMMIEKLVIRGLEFTGGVPDTGEPMVVTPAEESTINLGTNSADGLTQTIQIKAKNLEDDLTVVVSGTGLSLSYGQQTGQSSVTIPVGSTGKVSTSVDIVFSGWGGTTGSLEFYIGQDLISAATIVAASDIPSEYTRLEYVNNATKGFLTGVDCVASKEPFVGTTWELDVQGVSAQSTQILICSTWDTGHNIGITTSTSGYTMSGETFTTPYTTRGVLEVKFISLGLEATFNGETKSKTSTTNFNHWANSTGVIFKVSLLSDMHNDNATANAMIFKGKVYSIKCTSGGNFNGVPAKRNSDNILGIYDKYSDTFYPITT